MICPTCKEEGERSKVYEDGTFHLHYDDPDIWTEFECSRGHEWQVTDGRFCPASGCNYGEEKHDQDT